MDDQEFLNQAVRNAQDDELKQVLLTYQQAIFETLQSLQPCESDGESTDFVLLRKRAEKFGSSISQVEILKS